MVHTSNLLTIIASVRAEYLLEVIPTKASLLRLSLSKWLTP